MSYKGSLGSSTFKLTGSTQVQRTVGLTVFGAAFRQGCQLAICSIPVRAFGDANQNDSDQLSKIHNLTKFSCQIKSYYKFNNSIFKFDCSDLSAIFNFNYLNSNAIFITIIIKFILKISEILEISKILKIFEILKIVCSFFIVQQNANILTLRRNITKYKHFKIL